LSYLTIASTANVWNHTKVLRRNDWKILDENPKTLFFFATFSEQREYSVVWVIKDKSFVSVDSGNGSNCGSSVDDNVTLPWLMMVSISHLLLWPNVSYMNDGTMYSHATYCQYFVLRVPNRHNRDDLRVKTCAIQNEHLLLTPTSKPSLKWYWDAAQSAY
jgi:hypothetical protein